MKKPVINIEEVILEPRPTAFTPKGNTANRFDAKMGMISPIIGAQKLGYNITAVPPGKRAFPFHNHRVNEEMFFIIDGTGEVRIGENKYSIRPGDIISCPPGGKESAHQIINTGEKELRYLAVSTKLSPEIAEYPDSNKFGILAEFPSNNNPPQTFRFVGRVDLNVDYWDGE